MTTPSKADNDGRVHFKALEYEEFAAMVDRDIRGRAEASEAYFLREPDNLLSWLRELGFTKMSVDSSLRRITEQRKANPKVPEDLPNVEKSVAEAEIVRARKQNLEARGKALNFTKMVDIKINEAKHLIAFHGIKTYDPVRIVSELVVIEALLIDEQNDNALGKLHHLLNVLSSDDDLLPIIEEAAEALPDAQG